MSIHDNAPTPEQWFDFGGKVQAKLWPALKGRIPKEELARFTDEDIMLRLRNGFTKTPEGLAVPSSPFFANEEVPSTYGYPANHKVRPVSSQLVTLSPHFPKLSADSALAYADALPSLPQGAEGAFVIPQWQKVAKTYGEACEHVFKALASTRKFHNCREGQLGPKYLQQTERTEAAFAMLASWQKGDYLVVPAQFGLLHRCRSVRRARIVYQPHEFGLGAFAIGCMLLSHPARLQSNGDLYMDCPGDMFAPDADGEFVYAPIFYWYGGGIGFSTSRVGHAYAGYGSASGFIPPQ